MLTVNIHEAKTQLSHLLQQVSKGEEVIIGKAGVPIAKLIPFSKKSTERKPGYWRNKIVIRKDFDELPQSLIDAFKGEKG
jgi:prevent-host-death family protein